MRLGGSLALLLLASEALAQPTASFTTRTSGYATSESAGPAPLGVLLNATATTSGSSANAFHDLLYVWDFGDPGSGSWSYGVGNFSKNRAFGPIAGHLYKTPGTYTIRLTVRDGAGNVSTATSTVTVANPDSTFTLANTWCYANAANTFVGCALDTVADEGADDADDTPGDGICTGTNAANCTVTSSLAPLITNIDIAQRHQFRGGDVFTLPVTVPVPGLALTGTTGFIENFGSGYFIARCDPTKSTVMFNTEDASNYTIQNVMVDSPGGTSCGSIMAGTGPEPGDNLTLYDSFNTAGGVTSLSAGTSKDIFIQEVNTDVSDFQSVGFVFIFCDSCAYLGNWTNLGDPITALENNVRWMDSRNGVISNNKVEGGSDTKSLMTIRACDPTDATHVDCPAGTINRYVVVSDNLLIGSTESGWPAISLQEEHRSDTSIADFIIERNYVTCGLAACNGLQPALVGRSGQNADGDEITVRNNILNLRNTANSNNTAIVTFSVGDDPTYVIGDWYVYNNTLYASAGTSAIQFVKAPEGNFTIRGNLMYAPTKSTKGLGVDTGTTDHATFTTSNNLRDTTSGGTVYEYTGDPFVADGGSKDVLADFRITGTVTTGTSPLNNGYAFTAGGPYVFTDMFALCRPAGAGWDVGAHELNAGTFCLPSTGDSRVAP